MASQCLFLIHILSLLVWAVACGNPYLRADYDDTFELDSIGKRSVEEHSAEAPAKANLVDISDEDLALALSRMSVAELQSLDRVMDEESGPTNEQKTLDKRETNAAANDEDDAPQRKRNVDADYADYDGDEEDDEAEMDGRGMEKRCDRRHKDNRHTMRHVGLLHKLTKRTVAGQPYAPYRRQTTFNLAADKHVQAKINLLREKQKRQMALAKIENNVRNRDSAAANKERRNEHQLEQFDRTMDVNPYFNSLVGPRARTKRSGEGDGSDEQSKEEYIKMLAESFPNAANVGDGAHVRVKRGN